MATPEQHSAGLLLPAQLHQLTQLYGTLLPSSAPAETSTHQATAWCPSLLLCSKPWLRIAPSVSWVTVQGTAGTRLASLPLHGDQTEWNRETHVMGAGSEEMETSRRCSDALKVKVLLLGSFSWPLGCYITSRAGKMIPLLVNIATFVQYLLGQQIFIACWSTQKGIWRSWIQLVTDEWEQVRLKGAELHNTVTWMRQLHPASIRNRRKIGAE